MHNHTNIGGQSATGSVAFKVPPQTGAVGFSSSVDGDRHRLHNAITRAWHRLDAAKRKSDFEARCAASIATLKEEQCHDQHQLEPVFETDLSRTAGANVLGAPAAPFNSQVAEAIETLRTLRTWL